MKISIGIGEAFAHYVRMAKEFALSPIPDRERLTIVIERLSKDVDDKRDRWQDALSEVIKIRHPEISTQGRLPRARARLERLEQQGAGWGAELQHPATSPERRQKLQQQLQLCDLECTRTEQEVSSLEQQLKARQDVLRLREAAYRKAKADLQKLRSVGATLVEQTDALQDAQRDRMAALKSAAERGEDTGAIVRDLQASFEEAQAGHAAAMVIEEDEVTPDIDAIIAAEQQEGARSARMDRWLGASAS